MQTFGSFLVSLVVASSFATAAPTTSTQDGGFSVPVIHNGHFKRNGPAALAKVYKKHNKPVPADVANAVHRHQQKRATGSATVTPESYDTAYFTQVQIGSPPQNLPLIFDTGSSDLWVFSTATPSNQVNGQTLYNPSRSSSARLLSGQSWSITYGDNSKSSGNVYTDVVTIGGLTVGAQAVEAAQQVSPQFSNDPQASGVLGLAFSSLNMVRPTAQKTFFDNAKPNLNSQLFTANLKHNVDGKINFGYIDNSQYTGSITYAPVDSSSGHWGWTSTGYAIGSGSFQGTSIPSIVDTGSTLLLLPNSIVSAYYSQVSGAGYNSQQGGYTFPCSAYLPSFTFGVAGSRITIPGSYMNFAPIDTAGQNCFGGLQSSAGIGINIFGDTAVKAAFVVFDGGNNRLGWAPKNL